MASMREIEAAWLRQYGPPLSHGEIVRKVKAREYEVSSGTWQCPDCDKVVRFDSLHLCDDSLERFSRTLACESSPQPVQDYLTVLTAVMALTEGEQQQIYEALYKAGRRIYR